VFENQVRTIELCMKIVYSNATVLLIPPFFIDILQTYLYAELRMMLPSVVFSYGSRLETLLLFIVSLYYTVLDLLFICYIQYVSIYA